MRRCGSVAPLVAVTAEDVPRGGLARRRSGADVHNFARGRSGSFANLAAAVEGDDGAPAPAAAPSASSSDEDLNERAHVDDDDDDALAAAFDDILRKPLRPSDAQALVARWVAPYVTAARAADAAERRAREAAKWSGDAGAAHAAARVRFTSSAGSSSSDGEGAAEDGAGSPDTVCHVFS